MDADTIMRRLHELEEENKQLKSLLAKHGIPFEACAHDGREGYTCYFLCTDFDDKSCEHGYQKDLTFAIICTKKSRSAA